jgi:hypothetical protein
MVLYIKVRQDSRSRLVGKRQNICRAKFRSYAVVREEER